MHLSVCVFLLHSTQLMFFIVLHNMIFWQSTSFVYCLISLGTHWCVRYKCVSVATLAGGKNYFVSIVMQMKRDAGTWSDSVQMRKWETIFNLTFYIFDMSVDLTMLENRIQNDVTIKVNGELHSVILILSMVWLFRSCCFSMHLILLCINRIDFCCILYFNKVILSKSEHCSFVSVLSSLFHLEHDEYLYQVYVNSISMP